MGNYFRSAFFARFFADDAKNCKCKRFCAANGAEASATRTCLVRRFTNRWTQSLSRHFQQAEATDLPDLHTGAILIDGVTQAVLNIALIFLWAHIDKVDYDQAAKVANSQLAGDFFSCFEVRVQSRRFDITALGSARRVDVNGDHRLGVVNDNAASRRQGNFVCKCRFDLRLNLESRK